MRHLIGIDDTDNLETRGTGNRVRDLVDYLIFNQLAELRGVTRHQLLVDPRIPYTSHNSSACLAADTEQTENVWNASRQFLLLTSADGSDAGLCLARWDSIKEEVLCFGRRAKVEVLTILETQQTASRSEIRCEGLTGTGGRIIGALAGVGLHWAGNDGRFLWLPGLRGLKGKFPVEEIISKSHIERVCTLEDEELSLGSIVNVGEWVRPVLRNGKSTLYVEEQDHEWHIISKDRIKSLSD